MRHSIPSMRQLLEAVQPSDEHWELIETDSGSFYAGWQTTKDALNRQNHDGLSLRDGIPVVANPDNEFETQFEHGEERDKVIGHGAGGIPLVVVCVWLDTGEQIPSVRIISVRRAYPHELNEGLIMDEDVKQPPEQLDPDNPPLPRGVKRMRWGDRIAQKVADQKAKHRAEVAKQQPANDRKKTVKPLPTK